MVLSLLLMLLLLFDALEGWIVVDVDVDVDVDVVREGFRRRRVWVITYSTWSHRVSKQLLPLLLLLVVAIIAESLEPLAASTPAIPASASAIALQW